MDVSFVLSLEHLTCEKIVMSLLNDSDLLWSGKDDYNRIKSEVTEKISRLTPSDLLRRKLEKFIAPLLYENKRWLTFCQKNWTGFKVIFSGVRILIPQCRLPDGTIDRERFVNALIKDKNINPLNRFILAGKFCMFEDVLELWNDLHKIEKGFLRNRYLTDSDISYFIVGHWVDWLEGSTDKDWKSFVAWALETPVWKSNIYMLRRILQTLSPIEKSPYLLKALTGGEVSSDIMWYGLSIMPRDEREVVFKESPLEVFRCLLSWPLRNVFFVFANQLWPYVTEDIFLEILHMMLGMINEEKNDWVELISIVKTFWEQSPDHFKKSTEKNSDTFEELSFVLNHDLSKPFRRNSPLDALREELNRAAELRVSTVLPYLFRPLNQPQEQ